MAREGKTLRAALERFSGGPTPTKSDLEERFSTSWTATGSRGR